MGSLSTKKIRALVDKRTDQMIEIRRELHEHPELSFEETGTTELIDGACGALGLDKGFCPTPTGAVWTLNGGKPGKTVIIRADIDALPILEESDLSFRSKNDGAMHACGHDAHVAQALGAAGALSARAEDLPGRYVFLFQPAEEGLGGAAAMIEGGVLEGLNATAVIGCHLASIVPAGLVGVRAGVTMADVYALRIEITGIGGHGAAYTDGANPLLAGAHLVTRLGDVVANMSLEGTDCQRTGKIESPSDSKAYFALRLAPHDAEVFAVLFLDASHHIIAFREMFFGTLTQTSVYPREIVRTAMLLNAAAVVLGHQHPSSGNPEPSRADELLTKVVVDALRLVDVRVLDPILFRYEERAWADVGGATARRDDGRGSCSSCV